MNEYEYQFMQDCREKKRTASGARHRATRGKRSFTVHNPSDYLTQKQIKEMSSPVTTFQAKPMTYDEFKTLDEHQQRAYLNYLLSEYGISIRAIGNMMGVSFYTINRYIQRFGITVIKRTRITKAEQERWDQFLSQSPPQDQEITVEPIEEPTEPIEPIEPTEEPKQEPTEEPQGLAVFATVDRVTLSGSNKDTLADDIRRALIFILPDHKSYKITIETI